MKSKIKAIKIDWEFDFEEEYEVMTFNGIIQIIKWVEKNEVADLFMPVYITGFQSWSELTVSGNHVSLRIDLDFTNYLEKRKWNKLRQDCISIDKYKAEVL